jgi:hypothetical protein
MSRHISNKKSPLKQFVEAIPLRRISGVVVFGGCVFGSYALALGAASDGAADRVVIDGTYAGTFICSSGEMGMTLSIKDMGPGKPEMLGGTCRSGAGPCNDARDARLVGMREIGGVLNFFPTSGNPSAPAGAFKVSGSADISFAPAAEISLSPGDWIERPRGFGASAMTATLLEGEMVGKPTAPGCYTLKLRKIKGE